MAAGDTYPLGDGTLTIGGTGTEIDVSCLVNNATIAADKDEGDSTTKLCGTVRPGAVTYTYSLSGNVDTDIDDPDGLFALSQLEAGSEQPFTFTPNTDAGSVATGTLVIDPLDFGGDTMGETMASDFEFSIVGAPSYQFGPDTPPVTARVRVVRPSYRNDTPAADAEKADTSTAKKTTSKTAASSAA